ncbi:MAG: PD-(D/E)XK nuclease family transposase [Bifidobacteriaceae bacterium]|jgi:predicted transposase/invertase (TIGR01784 family)|nr:PD-(D/E)XK nuclease family transposase [Bifidobacteriaceae bacterium]
MGGQKRLRPTSDLAFKKLLASEGHKEVTRGFVADFFGIEADLGDIRIENPYSISPADLSAGAERLAALRQTFRDVTVSVGWADVVVEMQMRLTKHFEARSLYYLFDRFNSHYDRAAPGAAGGPDWRYSSLRAVFSLNILGEPFREGDAALRVYRLWDPALGEAMEPEWIRAGYLDLTKSAGLTAPQEAWRRFLLTGVAPPGAPAYLAEASTMIEYVNLGREEREMVDVMEKAIATHQAEMAYAEERAAAQGLAQGLSQGLAQGLSQGLAQGLSQGLAEGRAEGAERAAREVAARLLAMGLDRAAVARATGLDEADLDPPAPVSVVGPPRSPAAQPGAGAGQRRNE